MGSGHSFSNFWAGALLLPASLLTGCGAAPPKPAGPPPVTIRFEDRSAAAGLSYRWQIPGARPLNILQTIGNGAALLDCDGDGSLDVLLVGPRLALYRGDGKGGFREITQGSGLNALHGQFLGCAVGDYDNDGFPDLYLSGYRTGALLHNEGSRRFRDVSSTAGVPTQPWGTSCAFADLDGDGALDLVIANYARFGQDPGIPQLCTSHGIRTSCGPRYYTPLKPAIYRNLGRGRFEALPPTQGPGSASGRGLGVALAAIDGSRFPTLAIANDELPGDLLSPVNSARFAGFRNTASLAGTSVDRQGNIHGGMGTDWGDYDNDGRLDLLVTTFEKEPKNLYRATAPSAFSDASAIAGLDPPTLNLVSFGCKFVDADNDGWLDLLIASGHVQDNINQIDPSASYRQPTLILRSRPANSGLPVYQNVGGTAGPFFKTPIVGRGVAVGDYDNDGRVDAVVVDSEGAPALLHNESTEAGHWLCVKLRGVKSSRDGLGALVTVKAGAASLLRHCHTDGSYLSASDSRVHFGLGDRTVIDSVTVRWPAGGTDTYHGIPIDRQVTLREGGSAPGS
jgi:hypothetical protein